MRNRIAVTVAGLATLLVGALAGWQLGNRADQAEPEPVTEKFERVFAVRTVDGKREVFVRTSASPEGAWYPLVEKTDSPLQELIPDWSTPGPVAHVNRDGTILLTDHLAAKKRVESDPRKAHGWPMPPSGWHAPCTESP